MTEQTPSIGISLSIDVAKGRNLVFQTHIDRDAPVPWINTLLDRLNTAADRQQAIYELEYYEFQLRQDESQFNDMTTKMGVIREREQAKAAEWSSSGRRGDFKRSPNEQQHYEGLLETLARLDMTMKATKARIDTIKGKIGEKAVA